MRREVFYRLWRALTVLAAIIFAAGGAAVVVTLFDGEMKQFPLTFLFILIPSAVLGIPIYAAVKSAGRANWKTAAVAGFFVGAIMPAIAVFLGPSADQASVGGVPTVIDGSYTWAGWRQGLTFLAGFGLLGALGGLVFYFAVSPSQQQRLSILERDSFAVWRSGILVAGAAGVVAAAFAISEANKDRSCHNPLRAGGTSIASTASFDLKVGPDQWRHAERIIHDFGVRGDWDILSDVRPDGDFKWFQMSLCREPGTQISVQGLAEMGTVYISVFQPQGGNSWREPFGALFDTIEANWPQSLEFQSVSGETISRADWILRLKSSAAARPAE